MSKMHQQVSLSALQQALDQTFGSDRSVLRRRLAGLQRRERRKLPIERGLASLSEAIAASQARVADRRARLPTPDYPADLPVTQRREELLKAIAEHQVLIVCGETGSGKSTQLPKLCLELGRGALGMIAHTQPRRIAARTLAARISEELQSELGQAVGYKVRFKIGRASCRERV